MTAPGLRSISLVSLCWEGGTAMAKKSKKDKKDKDKKDKKKKKK
ncbi:hypothetical protein FB565_006534 [Actinoplanes lutulentus]|uniref:Uncharacterized protein n=1 Tax=Actinoplanes lutulentus TaxID=1287878 RepID=A0A327ZB84_9ACTN|nr:hypothetical protein [Actinoplanes lutulentus]RAK35658.1 hypothetical protein B0I29_109132 [Actinoplanes lutulentus]